MQTKKVLKAYLFYFELFSVDFFICIIRINFQIFIHRELRQAKENSTVTSENSLSTIWNLKNLKFKKNSLVLYPQTKGVKQKYIQCI